MGVNIFEKQRPPHLISCAQFGRAEDQVMKVFIGNLDFGRAKCGVEQQLSRRRQDLLDASPIPRAHRMSGRSFLHHMFLSARNFKEARDRHISLLVMCFGRKSRADSKAMGHVGFFLRESGVCCRRSYPINTDGCFIPLRAPQRFLSRP